MVNRRLKRVVDDDSSDGDYVPSDKEIFLDSEEDEEIAKGNKGKRKVKDIEVEEPLYAVTTIDNDLDSRNESREIPVYEDEAGRPGRVDDHSFFPPRIKKRRRRKDLDDDYLHPGTEDLEWRVWERQMDAEYGHDDKYIYGLWGCEEKGQEEEVKKPMEEYETPKDLVQPLLPFQKEFLAWSMKKESQNKNGGILADEMGMGKTIQAISLILAGRAAGHGHAYAAHQQQQDMPSPSSDDSSTSTTVTNVKATLVVCPVVALAQWQNEIERFTEKGSLTVLVYHVNNPNRRRIAVEDLEKYDIVLTTYSIVEHEYRKMLPDKLKCPYCKKAFSSLGLGKHVKYYCGPFAQKSAAQSKTAKKGKKGKKGKKVEEKGKQKMTDMELEIECRRAVLNAERCTFQNGSSLMHSVKWTRVILDEAHYIKDRSSNTARAIFALESCYKWALSGTPLQNRVGELYSLIRFLVISPFSYFFCKHCECKLLDAVPVGSSCKCGHSPSNHFCWWNKYISKPVTDAGGFHYEGAKAMKILQKELLDHVLLRRTKIERAADLAIPPKIVRVRKEHFDFKEYDFYESLQSRTQSQFNTYVQEGTVLNNYAHIFDLLTRLRQAVDHPYLLVSSSNTSTALTPLCGICHDDCTDPVAAECGDNFCSSCLEEFMDGDNNKVIHCPKCGKPLTVDAKGNDNKGKAINNIAGYKKNSIINRLNLKDFQSSTKIEALKEEVMLMMQMDPCGKALVFSQFTSMLDLIGYVLQLAGVKCVKLDGTMSVTQRSKIIDAFRSDPECKVFLMSLKAGGVALNLTVASHIFLMDPWWNPAVEHQAQDRIHRIGQFKPIRVTRFIIADSVEERILRLQEKKQLVFEGTVGGSSEALGKLSVEDFRFLFSV